jgi:beta-sarcoglycan
MPVNRFMMGSNGTEFKGLSQITITDPDTNLPIFASTNLKYKLEKPLKNLEANVVHAAEVVSPIDKEFKVDGMNIHVRGIEGTTMDGKEVYVSAERDIFLKSSNGSIKISSLNGIYIDIDRIPVAPEVKYSQTRSDLQYKLCVCYPKGILYRVPLSKMHGISDPCRHFDGRHFNPCL